MANGAVLLSLLAFAMRCEAIVNGQAFNATPAKLLACPGAVEVTECMTSSQYDAVVAAVRGKLESLPSTCTASDCPQADWAGCVLRMAGHDFMDFANGQGGSDACTDMEDPENAGLPACLASGEHGSSLQEVYQQFCTQVSLADFLVIAAEAVIASTRARAAGTASLDLRSIFRFGRRTASSCDFAVGRLPDPERGCTAVEETFVTRMGLTWTQAAALMGVHTLGRAQVQNSGYHGWWSDPENSRKFNNNYYVSLLAKGWLPELAINGNSAKNQWERSDIGRDTSVAGHEMMLNTDLCLAFSEGGGNGGPVRAHEHNCCAWLSARTIDGAVRNNGNEYCGGNVIRGRGDRDQCCGRQATRNDCGDKDRPTGPAAAAVLDFAADEAAWLRSFADAWQIATENGHSQLHRLGDCGSTTETAASSVSSISSTPETTSSLPTETVTSTEWAAPDSSLSSNASSVSGFLWSFACLVSSIFLRF